MRPPIIVTERKSTLDREFQAFVAAMRPRLIAVRKAMDGDNQAAFARRLGYSPTRWNNFERGSPITMKVLLTLTRRQKGLVAYLERGDTSQLPAIFVRKLAVHDADIHKSEV